MSQTPLQIVTAFLDGWAGGVASLRQAFDDYLADDVVYENVDLTHTTTRADAKAIIDNFMDGLDHVTIDMLNVAEIDNKVLTERVDYIRDKDGGLLIAIRVMGIFEVNDGRITGWRDYFDGRPFASS